MKKFLSILFLLAPSSAFADITAKYVTSAQISIDSPYVITNAAPSTYSISGNNITTSTGTGDSVVTNAIGGLNLGSLSNGVPALVNTNKTVTTAGSAFSLTESYQAGDVTQSSNYSKFWNCIFTSIGRTDNRYFWGYCWKPCFNFAFIRCSFLYCWRLRNKLRRLNYCKYSN